MAQYCPNCYNYRHSFKRAAIGFLAWHLVSRWWLSTRLWWKHGIIPPFLATAGDWIYDTRGCGCRVALIDDGEAA
jgi:hypothetical protein